MTLPHFTNRSAVCWLFIGAVALALAGCFGEKVDSSAFGSGDTSQDTSASLADAGAQDSGLQDGSAGAPDTAPPDTTTPDAAALDSTAPDATTPDTTSPDAPAPDSGPAKTPWAKAIYAGGYVTCAIRAAGGLSCWGRNSEGQVGNGGAGGDKVTAPSDVPGLADVKEVAGGMSHACALHGGGKVSCWGHNFYAQLGKGTKHDTQSAPVLTKLSVAATHIGGSYYASMASGANKVWGWGSMLGDKFLLGGTQSVATPTEIKHVALAGDTQGVCAGDTFACALGADSLVRCWGGSTWGEVGHDVVDSTTKPLLPAPVVGLGKVNGLTCGAWHACAWVKGGKAWCWGKNLSGQLGNGGKKNVAAATAVAGLSQVIHVAAGGNHTCAASANGDVHCWGGNDDNQAASSSPQSDVPTPAKVAFAGKAVQVAAGRRHSCLLDTSGAAHCWGSNKYGQLGDGSTTSSAAPVAVK